MLDSFGLIYKHRKLLLATTEQALRGRFVGNVLGAIWLALFPLLFLGMYSLVYVYVLGVRIPGLETDGYVLIIFCGLVPFLAFSEAFGVGTPSIVANRTLLRNTLFPIELVVVRDVIVGHATMGLGMIMVWIAAAYQGHIYKVQLLVPVLYVMQILMTVGVVWITSTLTVFFRDLQQAVPIIVLFLMLVSPIAYTDDMVPIGMRALLDFNPLAWLMRLYRAFLVENSLPLGEFLIFSAFSVVLFVIGFRLISRLKPLFSDYV